MNKDAYYFPHDSNAKDDPKCLILIEELGLEGYGIFWVLIETLRDQKDFKAPIRILPALARRYNTSVEKIKAVVNRYELFEVQDEKFFFSRSLINRMNPLLEKKQQKKIGGIKGNLIKYGHATKKELDALTDDEIVALNEKKVGFSHTDHLPTGDRSHKRRGDKKKEDKSRRESGETDPQFSEDSKPYQLSEYLLGKVLEFQPTHAFSHSPPDLHKWSEDADRMHRLDKRDYKDCARIVKWVFDYFQPKDDFDWRDNVQSIKKLRKHYDKLESQMNKTVPNYEKRQSDVTDYFDRLNRESDVGVSSEQYEVT